MGALKDVCKWPAKDRDRALQNLSIHPAILMPEPTHLLIQKMAAGLDKATRNKLEQAVFLYFMQLATVTKIAPSKLPQISINQAYALTKKFIKCIDKFAMYDLTHEEASILSMCKANFSSEDHVALTAFLANYATDSTSKQEAVFDKFQDILKLQRSRWHVQSSWISVSLLQTLVEGAFGAYPVSKQQKFDMPIGQSRSLRAREDFFHRNMRSMLTQFALSTITRAINADRDRAWQTLKRFIGHGLTGDVLNQLYKDRIIDIHEYNHFDSLIESRGDKSVPRVHKQATQLGKRLEENPDRSWAILEDGLGPLHRSDVLKALYLTQKIDVHDFVHFDQKPST